MSANNKILDHAIDTIDDIKDHADVYGADLHNELFNTDYFIIGRYEADKWLKDNVDGGVYDAIYDIKEYEENNFGEVTTDFSEPERVTNMYVYIKGEELLNESDALNKAWDRKLTEKDFDAIRSDLKNLYD